MIREILEQYDIPYAPEKEEQLRGYMNLVLDRNESVNLTAIREPEEFIQKHYADSLSISGRPEFLGAREIMDLGTGGGFPGVPLAVAFPDKNFTLVDSLQKRIKIIQEFCQKLGIHNVTAIHGRAEDLGRREDLREHFDLCVSRAVADLSVLSEYCLPFVRKDGWFISYKGADCEKEIHEAEYAIKMLGGELVEISNYTVNAAAGHKLLLIRKIASTQSTYPRRSGKPAKSPLRASK